MRVCNSNDYSEEQLYRCFLDDVVENKYDEVRIAMGNWDSTIFLSWIMQIILSVSFKGCLKDCLEAIKYTHNIYN